MSKKTWFKLGLIISIVLYLAVSSLAIINYQTNISARGLQNLSNPPGNKYNQPSFSEKYIKGYLNQEDAITKTRFINIRNTILILNPFWIGIVIFSVLLKKTIAKPTEDKLS